MNHKVLLNLIALVGIVAFAACTANPASPTPAAGMPNPASVNCEQNSGKVELIEDASGVAGRCVFPDGSVCDEWAFLRGECKPGDSLATADPPASASPVPASPSPTTEPAVSPTPMPNAPSLRVAYYKAGHVMLWSEGAEPRSVAEASNVERVRISDDGQMVAYLGRNANGVYELFGASADGTEGRLLVSQNYLENILPRGTIVDFDFAPASHTLYFVTDQYDLRRVSAADAGPVSIFVAGEGGFFSFSPDGQWMVLYHPNELVLAHPDGAGARVVFQYPEEFSYTMVDPEIIWKGDSSGFNFVSAIGPQDSADNMAIWFMPVAGKPARQIVYTGPYGASLSPDGQSVVYLDFKHEPTDVHVVTADGKDAAYGSFANVSFMGWAPDSQQFLLNLSPDQRLKEPFLCTAGEEPAKLTDTDDAFPVHWLDAQRVLFASHGQALRLQRLSTPSILVDGDASSWFDYASIKP